MLIGPIVFLTIVGGIASVADLKKVGMTGLKALTYFQIGTIFALLFGLVAINIFRLGDGVNADASAIKTSDSAAKLIDAGAHQEWWQFLTHIIPTSIVAPFVEGDILQIIFIAVIFGIALNAMGKVGAPVLDGVQRLTGVMFKILGFIMKAAPLGAFGAMAFAVGKYGVSSLSSMGGLIALFYATSILFVVVVLGSVMAFLKLNIFKMIRHLKEEYLLILGTSTAEPALPGLMRKLEHAGVKKETVGLVVPTGYSFNLDGAAIYLSLAAVYIAQATNTNLTIGQQLGLHRGHAAHVQGRRRRRGRRLHRPDRHAGHTRHHPGRRHHAHLRHRQVHVRMPGPGELHRQRRRHLVHRLVGPHAGRGPCPPGLQRRNRRAHAQRGPDTPR